MDIVFALLNAPISATHTRLLFNANRLFRRTGISLSTELLLNSINYSLSIDSFVYNNIITL